jgi:cyclopropane fatty-acyl-phospholipid synthase-like methyltransferase
MDSASSPHDPKQVVAQGYDQVAHIYAGLEGETAWPRMRWLGKVLAQLAPGSAVLDLGCGSGIPADIEIAKRHKVTGVDISQAQVDLARRNVPSGTFLHADTGAIEFPPAAFDAAVSFYTLEHIPRAEHAAILGRICGWLRPGGLLLISMEAGEYDNVEGTWLGVPMFLSCHDPAMMLRLVEEAGFALVETAIEGQVEQGQEIPYLWVIARKQ